MESVAPHWLTGGEWVVEATPVLDLTDRAGPEYEFYRVSSAIRLRDGSIAVANAGSNAVRVFAPTGEFVASFGREGEGPGEFRRLSSIHEIQSDSILAFDFWLRRMVLIDLQDSTTRTEGIPEVAARVRHIAVLANGQIVGIAYDYEEMPERGAYRLPYLVFTFSRSDSQVDTIARIRGAEGYVFEHGDVAPLYARNGFLAVHRNRVYLGEADSMQIEVHDLRGLLEMIMRVPGYDLRITAEDAEADQAALKPTPQVPAFMSDVLAELPARQTRPAYSKLLVDAAGFVWAPEYHGIAQADSATRCVIFDPEGEWLGTVSLPARFTPFEVGEDYILGVFRDGADIEHVQVLRLKRGG